MRIKQEELCCHSVLLGLSVQQKMKPISDQEENELVILHLRQLCEAKQKTHVHIGEGPLVRHVLPDPFCLFLVSH